MNLPDIPLFAMLRERMSWLNQRQGVLSQNVANADTPGYGARDLKAPDFETLLRNTVQGQETSSGLRTTNSKHIALQSSAETGGFTDYAAPDVEASLNGNSVSLEGEMMKMADTQASYQAATNLYSKAVDMMRTAIGRTS
ncbi:MAG TPA: flagellar basal body rod protein FlgB [Rhizomicrobium sp.]|jgi:flagellar basal-body rod protein FlgB|nr:flagellar basal body rod protein FlgB [Rhizomicrobium sp.]